MAKQSAIQKNLNRKTLIDRLSEKRKKLKKLLANKILPFEERVKIQMKLESLPRNSSKIDLEIDVFYLVGLEVFTVSLIYQE
jgi:small subunit ribosomal protein S14